MSRQYDIMVAGHLCLDIIPRFTDTGATKIEEIMRPGKLVNVGEAMVSTGGPVSNTGLNMKTLGSNVCFCACAGDDQFGKLAVAALPRINREKARRTLAKLIATSTLDSEHEHANRTYLDAARELARLGDERGKRALRKAASSRIVQVRRCVSNAIFLGLGEEGRPLLVKLAGDADPEVAKWGKWWLNELHILAEQRKADDARARAH